MLDEVSGRKATRDVVSQAISVAWSARSTPTVYIDLSHLTLSRARRFPASPRLLAADLLAGRSRTAQDAVWHASMRRSRASGSNAGNGAHVTGSRSTCRDTLGVLGRGRSMQRKIASTPRRGAFRPAILNAHKALPSLSPERPSRADAVIATEAQQRTLPSDGIA